jgi:hypothetical protein
MARRITTPRRTQPQGEELDVAVAAVVVVVVGCVVDVVVSCDRVVVVTGALVVVVVGTAVVVVVGGVVLVVVVGGAVVVVVSCAPAPVAAKPIRSGAEATRISSATPLDPPAFMTTA